MPFKNFNLKSKKSVLVALIIFVLVLFLLSAVTTLFAHIFFDIKLNLLSNSKVESIIIFNGYIFFLLIYFQKYILKTSFKEIGFDFNNKTWRKDVLLGWSCAFLLCLVYVFFGVLTQSMELSFDAPLKKWGRFILNVPTAFGVAVSEEWIFRGFALTLFRKGFSAIVSIILVSLIFSFCHFLDSSLWWTNPVYILKFVGLFILGCMLCSAYIWKKSLFLAIGLHAGLVTYRVLVRSTGVFTYSHDTIMFGSDSDPRTAFIVWLAFFFVFLYFARKISFKRLLADGDG